MFISISLGKNSSCSILKQLQFTYGRFRLAIKKRVTEIQFPRDKGVYKRLTSLETDKISNFTDVTQVID